MLRRVHTRLHRRRPRGRVHARRAVALARLALPVDEEGDRVLGLRHAVVRLARGDARGRARDDARRRHLVLHDPAADVDVVRGEVVRDVRVLAGPRAEGLELRLGLRHPRAEEVHLAERGRARLGVAVDRVEPVARGSGLESYKGKGGNTPLVVLDEADDVVFLRQRNQLVVVLNRLHGGLGNENVDLALDRILCNVVVGVCNNHCC